MIKTLLKCVGRYKSDAIKSIIVTGLEAITEIILPILMAMIIDKGISAGDMNSILKYGIIMAITAAFALFLGIQSGKCAAYASSGFAANLRSAMFKNIQTFSFSNIDKYSTAGLVTRLMTDASNVQMSFQMLIRICIRSPFMLIFSMIMTFLISKSMSLIFLAAIIFLIIVVAIIVTKSMKAFTEVFKKYDDLNASVQENVTGIRVVKAYVREQFETDKFEKSINNVYKMFVKAESMTVIAMPMMLIAVYACIILLSWSGAHEIVAGNLTTGQLTSLFSYVMSIMISLMMMSLVFVMLTMSQAGAKRIAQVLDEKTDITNPENPIMQVANGDIDFNHVYFSYGSSNVASNKYVLNDIDIHIKSGETIGIIGGTGSSKSSLVNLISRLYDVKDGSVCVGDIDVRNYDLKVLRDQVSVVLQNNVLFSGSIYDNLRWGDENATDDECKEAARLACADEFIDKMPDGYNTMITQGGTNVSGGQKQRLCIARALLKKPKILILDDSTSAVDTATDAKIREAFREYIPSTTKIIISQRISSVKDADRIIVLDEGKIVGFDTHDNLMKDNEIYQSVAAGQAEGTGDFDRIGA